VTRQYSDLHLQVRRLSCAIASGNDEVGGMYGLSGGFNIVLSAAGIPADMKPE
jgi:hypothetical protein